MKTQAALVILLLALPPFGARAAGFVDSFSGAGGGAAPGGGYPGLFRTEPGAQGGGQALSPQQAYQTYLAHQNARKAANGARNAQRNEAFRLAEERAAEEKRLQEMRQQQQQAAGGSYPAREEASAPVRKGAPPAPPPREPAAESYAPRQTLGYPYTLD